VESPSLEIFQPRLDAVLCSLLWVTLLGQGVGLGDPQRSLPTPTILWFCDSVICLDARRAAGGLGPARPQWFPPLLWAAGSRQTPPARCPQDLAPLLLPQNRRWQTGLWVLLRVQLGVWCGFSSQTSPASSGTCQVCHSHVWRGHQKSENPGLMRSRCFRLEKAGTLIIP